MDKVIDVTGVVKRYGDKTVVRDVDLSVRAAEHMVLIGHNGAGKTTLMKLMLGLTHPSAGRVRVLGGDPATAGADRAAHSVTFPRASLEQRHEGQRSAGLLCTAQGCAPAECR